MKRASLRCCWAFKNALILGTDASAIETFYADGVRLFALTHMGHNAFADSSRPLFDAATGQREANGGTWRII